MAGKGIRWTGVSLGVTLLSAGLLRTGLAPAGASAPRPALSEAVIVRASGALDEAEAAVVAHGGRVDRELRIIDGFSAHVPADRITALATAPAIAGVSLDSRVSFASTTPPPPQTPTYSASSD